MSLITHTRFLNGIFKIPIATLIPLSSWCCLPALISTTLCIYNPRYTIIHFEDKLFHFLYHPMVQHCSADVGTISSWHSTRTHTCITGFYREHIYMFCNCEVQNCKVCMHYQSEQHFKCHLNLSYHISQPAQRHCLTAQHITAHTCSTILWYSISEHTWINRLKISSLPTLLETCL